MLMVILNSPLKAGEAYSIHLSTQYAKMGARQTSIIRRCVKEFSFEKIDGKFRDSLKTKEKAS